MQPNTRKAIYAALGVVYASLLAAMQQNLIPAHYVAIAGAAGIALASAMKAFGDPGPLPPAEPAPTPVAPPPGLN